MKFSKFILLIILFLLFGFNNAQQKINLDSLWQVWYDQTKEDTCRLKAMNQIAFKGNLFTHPDSAFYFAQQLYDFANSLNNKKWMANALNIQGASFYVRANYEKAMQFYINSFEIRKELGDQKQIADSYNNIGLVYKDQGNLEMALENYQNNLNIRIDIGDEIGMGNAYDNIGVIYGLQANYEKSLEFIHKSLEIHKKLGNKKSMFISYGNIGNIYQKQGDYDNALTYFKNCLKICKKLGYNKGAASSLNNIGNIFQDKADSVASTYLRVSYYENALENYFNSLDIRKNIGDLKGIGQCYNNIGNVYKNQLNYEKSLEYYEMSLKISNDIGDKKGVGDTYNNIGNFYKEQGDFEKALEYYKKAKSIIFQEINVITGLDKTSMALVEMYEKLGDTKKALENHKLYLTIKDSLATMDGIEKEKQRQFHEQYLLQKQADSIKHSDEIILHQAEVKIEKQKRNGLIIISLLILSSLGLVFTQLKKVRKGKILIEQKQKEITDSINYAKRLQDGIFVPFDLVQSWLSESFILFKPKDIVSGDFYWIEKLGNKIYFAVADCTGHGIPGALVSIICSNALSKALYEDKVSSPSRILDITRSIVEKQFSKLKSL